jgi:hypothetical protein
MAQLYTNLESFGFKSEPIWDDQRMDVVVPAGYALVTDQYAPRKIVAAFSCSIGGEIDSFFPETFEIPVSARKKWISKVLLAAGLSYTQEKMAKDNEAGLMFARSLDAGEMNQRVADYLVEKVATLLADQDVGYFSPRGWMIAHAFFEVPEMPLQAV